MSTVVGVNLLPAEVGKRNQQRKLQAAAGVAGLAVAAGLVALYLVQVGRVNNAKDELATEQAEVDRLRAEVNELAEFSRLRDLLEQVDVATATLLGGEVSAAGVLQDIAAVIPSDASIDSLSVTLLPSETGLGSVVASAESLLGHAPGLERLLIAFERAGGFRDVFSSGSTLDETGIASFTFEFNLSEALLTGRYLNGLPEVLR